MDEFSKLKETIAEKSSRFYELIPHSQFREEAIRPLNDLGSLRQKIDLVESLLDIELVTKMIIAAHYNS